MTVSCHDIFGSDMQYYFLGVSHIPSQKNFSCYIQNSYVCYDWHYNHLALLKLYDIAFKVSINIFNNEVQSLH